MLDSQGLIQPFLVSDGSSARTLRAKVVKHIGSIKAAALNNELLPVDLAELIARRLVGLLDELEKYSSEHTNLVFAAARYFISKADLHPDTGNAMGLEDDLAVLNFVLVAIGRPELVLEDA